MIRKSVFLFVLVLVAIIPMLAIAGMTAPPPDVVAQNSKAFSWAFGVALVAVCALLGMKVNADAKNNERQWLFISKAADDISDIKIALGSLQAICEINNGRTMKKRGDG